MKALLRREIERKLAAMPAEVAAAKSRVACSSLLAAEEFRSAGAIMLYAPIPREVDVEPVADAAWRAGKTVLAPKVDWSTERMQAVAIRSMDELVPGRFGLREPAGGEGGESQSAVEAWPIAGIDLIIVPALAYDRAGNRLGRGAGFYDRFLAQPGRRAVTCGLAFAEQLVDHVPMHENDVPVDMLVTDAEVLRFNRK